MDLTAYKQSLSPGILKNGLIIDFHNAYTIHKLFIALTLN